MSIEVIFGADARTLDLEPSPIDSGWVLHGNPIARGTILSRSADGSTWTAIWDCTAGEFDWFYGVDETVYVIDGSVIITPPGAEPRRVNAGDSIFFPCGSSARWNVEHYVRKVAFLRRLPPRPVQRMAQLYQSLARLLGRGRGGGDSIGAAPV